MTKFDPDSTTTAPTPEAEGAVLSADDSPPEGSQEQKYMKSKPVRAALGSLHFACKTRPDLQHAVCKVSAYAANPGVTHWKAIMRIFHYIRGTLHLRLTYRQGGKLIMMNSGSIKPAKLEARAADRITTLVDAGHAMCPSTRKSQSGWLMMLANATYAWGSKTQTVTALSSTEAEYIALASACAELCAIINQLKQLPFPELATGPHLVLEDNQACIKMATNPKGWKRTKHIDVRHHFVRDLVESDVVQIQHIGTDLQAADLLTKALHGKLFKKHRAFIMGYDQSY